MNVFSLQVIVFLEKGLQINAAVSTGKNQNFTFLPGHTTEPRLNQKINKKKP